MITRESRLFLRRWLHNPMQVGAIAPSSRRLADAIAGQVPFDSPGWVIELGGGTGVVTDALLRRGLAPARLVVIERDPLLHRHLVERFPHVHVILGDAAKLAEALRPLGIKPRDVKGHDVKGHDSKGHDAKIHGARGQGSGNGTASGRVAAIVSGLPLLTFPRPLQDEIVHAALAFLAAGAPLLQFTYGPMSPIARERLGLEGRVAKRVIGNLPPASVWIYRRLGESPKAESLKSEPGKAKTHKAGSRKADAPKAAAIKARRR
jgi:phosphatidylethanolamine/phosphatidyl-N-methylethanolamine N-methyltransferase